MKEKTLLVLAAGMGSRFGGLKQLDQFGPNGETIMDYSVFDAIRAGFSKAVFVIRKDFEEDFRQLVLSKFSDKIETALVFQSLEDLPAGFSVPEGRDKPWGTGHAVWVARNAISSSFAVINADDFYGRESYEIIANQLDKLNPAENSLHCLLGYRLDKTLSEHGPVSRGVCKLNEKGMLEEIWEYTKIFREDGRIKSIFEEREFFLSGNEIVSMNMMGFSPAVFESLEKYLKEFLENRISEPKAEFFLPILLNELIQNKVSQITVPETPSAWFGVTYREDKPWVINSINTLISKGEYPERLWA